MSAQHTRGLLEVHPSAMHPAIRSVGYGLEKPRRICTVGSMNGSSIDDANRRRLVACWNACDGIDTYALELMTGDLSIKNQITATGKARTKPTHRAVEYRRQRDELLAALEVAEESVGDINALEIVRAAISKVKSKTT